MKTRTALPVRSPAHRAEAFRLSMKAVVGALWQAHRCQWAPFLIVGRGVLAEADCSLR
jgi:hypothetical protein